MKSVKKYSRMTDNLIVIFGGLILMCIFIRSVINANTVWELSDEAGYLSNVAYFLGYDWNDVRSTMAFYGYGYSLFLIPAFLISETGVDMIKISLFTNFIFIIGTYLILIYLLEKVGKQQNRILTSAISFITCLNSYICCNVLKVNCESLCVFWYCLIVLVLYKAMEKKRIYWFIILGILSSYLYVIHTRMIILIVSLVCTLLISLWILNRKDNHIQIFLFGLVFVICFGAFYYIKNLIITFTATLNAAGDASGITQVNLIDSNYILQRIFNIFNPTSWKFYGLSFISKLYYLMIASAGSISFGYVYLIKGISESRKEKDESAYSVKVFMILGLSLMLIACTFNGWGSLEDFCYIFYSRYYENTAIPIIAFGILSLVTINWGEKKYIFCALLEVSISILVLSLRDFLFSESIRFDTARIPGFSWLVKNTSTFSDMILWGTLIIVLVICVYLIANKIKYKKVLTLVTIFLFIWNSTSQGIKVIDDVHSYSKPDTEIAKTILDSESSLEYIYMIDDKSYKYDGFYSRMQVLIKDIPLKVINVDELYKLGELEEGTWILTYKTLMLKDDYIMELNHVMSGAVFELWKK